MEYAEKGSLADALRIGRFKRASGYNDLYTVLSCLQDIANGAPLQRHLSGTGAAPLLFAPD